MIDTSHVHVGHTSMPFLSVESCHLRLFPGESHSSQIFLDYASPVCPWPTGSPVETWDLQYSAWCVMRWWSIHIVCPSQRSLLPLRVFRMLCCPVLILTSSFATLSFQQTPNMRINLVFHEIRKTVTETRNDLATTFSSKPELCTWPELTIKLMSSYLGYTNYICMYTSYFGRD